jgi:hypothetical protein
MFFEVLVTSYKIGIITWETTINIFTTLSTSGFNSMSLAETLQINLIAAKYVTICVV